MEGCVTIYIGETSAGKGAGLEDEGCDEEMVRKSSKLGEEGDVIDESGEGRELGRNSREGWKNSREEGSVAWLSSCSRNAHDKAVLI